MLPRVLAFESETVVTNLCSRVYSIVTENNWNLIPDAGLQPRSKELSGILRSLESTCQHGIGPEKF